MSSWALGGLWGCRSSCFCSITISRTLSPVSTTWRFAFHSLFLLTICLRNPSSIFIFHEWQSLCLQSRRTSLLHYLHPVLQPGLCFKAGEWVVATPPLLDCFLLLSQCWCGFSITVWEPLIVFAWVSCISWRESGCLLFSLMWEMPHINEGTVGRKDMFVLWLQGLSICHGRVDRTWGSSLHHGSQPESSTQDWK